MTTTASRSNRRCCSSFSSLFQSAQVAKLQMSYSIRQVSSFLLKVDHRIDPEHCHGANILTCVRKTSLTNDVECDGSWTVASMHGSGQSQIAARNMAFAQHSKRSPLFNHTSSSRSCWRLALPTVNRSRSLSIDHTKFTPPFAPS